MNYLKIFHIDCGRKYFAFEELKHIIQTLGNNGYNTIELAFGNGGMRFLLDDMEVRTTSHVYGSEEVKEAINAGNKAFCDCGSNELTENEMLGLIDVAKEKNIKIIPLLNSPGHMDTLVYAMEKLGIDKVRFRESTTTLNFDAPEAVEFTKCFITKYIQWFATRGSDIFNMGCDEYANDVLSSGFAVLCDKQRFRYDRFVEYVNDIAQIVLSNNLKPVMFNDGMYYEENTSGGTFNPKIICSYWSVGWPGYSPASAKFIEAHGHKIINTADKWYYVLGRRKEHGPEVMFTDISAKEGIENIKKEDVLGGCDNAPIGAMLCLWCDEPEVVFSNEEADIVDKLIELF